MGCLLETLFRSHLHAITHYPYSLCFSLSVQDTDQDLQPNEVAFGARGGDCHNSTFNKIRTGCAWMLFIRSKEQPWSADGPKQFQTKGLTSGSPIRKAEPCQTWTAWGSVTHARLLKERMLRHALPEAKAGEWPEVDSGQGVYPSLQTTQNKTKLYFGCWRLPEPGCVHAHTDVYVYVCTRAQVY